ncbi:MAG: SH3 domain-containing protein [Pseudomonadota bacterium]
MTRLRMLAALKACLFGAVIGVSGIAAADGPTMISQFSGKPVPRFETLRYSAVNGRAGPSRDHPILWRYEREGLPVLIIKESRDWRRVRDPDGDEVWMHARMLHPAPKAVVRHESSLLSKPEEGARETATVKPDVLVELERCDALWCEVDAGQRSGWILRAHLWGADASEAPL